jgi:translocation and assembly module TamA
MFEDAPRQIQAALEPHGYYSAQVSSELTGTEPRWTARFTVKVGEPVLIRESRVEVIGPAIELPAISAAIKGFEPAVGQPLVHGAYEANKAAISTLLGGSGFLDAEPLTHRVEVTRSTRSAAIDLSWSSGERYRFGEVTFPETQFSEDFLRRHIPWRAGDYFDSSQLLALQQRLVAADYFATVFVEPDREGRHDGVVPVGVVLTPAKRTIYTAGAFASTDQGPGGSLGVQRRWLNDSGHKAGAEISYSLRLQTASANYRIPQPGINNRQLSFTLGYRRETTDSSREEMRRLSASQIRDDWRGYRRTLGLQYMDGNFTVADEHRKSTLLFAEGLLERKEADSVLFSTRGHALTYAVRLAPKSTITDTSFAIARADAKMVRELSASWRAIVRGSVGAMAVSNFSDLPPELRFFAGGDRSVRGFDYQQIGDTNGTGGVIGGRFLAVASAEMEYYIPQGYGLAAFVDAGDAFNDQPNTNVSAGLGLRWKSPVGLLRLDVARPLVTDLNTAWRVHLIIGPDL